MQPNSDAVWKLAPAAGSPRTVAAGIGLLTLLLFARTAWFDFAYFDDHHFVVETREVTTGLSWANIAWAFTEAPYSCPLAWVSHMADCTLFGTWAGGHHLVNTLFHSANVVLLFVLVFRLTSRLWPAAIVAALFGWHPTHVESVAWIAERRDVLSTMFWLLAMLAYLRHAAAPRWTRMGVVFVLLLLGLLVKAMLITAPFALLLLDAWPLRRWDPFAILAGDRGGRVAAAKKLCHLLIEKLPLFLLAMVFVAEGYITASRTGGLSLAGTLSLADRIANSGAHFAQYLGITFWPSGLAAFYPLNESQPAWLVATGAGLAVGISIWVIATWRTSPWLATGWFWFVGTLVPVIGMVQGGRQSIADRYLYVPHIGLFVALVWEAAARIGNEPRRLRLASVGTAVMLAACVVLTTVQLNHWRNDAAVFGRILERAPHSWLAHLGFGETLMRAGRLDEAELQFKEALRLRPDQSDVWSFGARLLLLKGRHSESRAMFKSLFDRMTGPAVVHRESFLRRFQNDARMKPDSPEAHYNLANAFGACDRPRDAIAELERVLALRPGDASAHVDLGALLAGQAQPDRAIGHYRAALAGDPKHALAHANLGGLLSDQGKLDEALVHLTAAHQLQPANLATRYNLALALAKRGRHADAIPHLKAILSAQPGHANALNKLAWILATSPDAALRNGPEALALAGRLQELTGRSQAMAFDTEAAALAECGRFEEALTTARKGIERATASNAAALAARARGYEARVPFREPASPSTDSK
jgi:tetratricopeptide (TPR) repeat protein